MLTESGPKVLEYNVRFGDPETQALVRRFSGDLLPYLAATADGKLEGMEPPEWDKRFTVGVVGASEGYPGECGKGGRIEGLAEAEAVEDVVVFHAGTTPSGDGIATAGGRVLCVSSMASDMETARERAYEAYDRIQWAGKFCRRDIGGRVEARRTRVAELMGSKLENGEVFDSSLPFGDPHS
jgi:phosphoribosylamine--glycine ligase